MLGEDNGNPLAEVGLALSMAFFSLMVLMLVAILNKSPSNKNIEFNNNIANQKTEDLTFYIYSGDQLYDRELKPVEFEVLSAKKNPVLAIDPELKLEKIIKIIANSGNKSLKVTQIDTAWQTRIRQNNSPETR